jgi:hypothetical protein
VFPKRAFADEGEQQRFRELVGSIGRGDVGGAEVVEKPRERVMAAAPAVGAIELEFQYRYRDILVRNLYCWFTRIVMIGGVGVVAYAFYSAARTPDPGAVHSHTFVFFTFGLPVMVVMAAVGLFTIVTKEWSQIRSQILPLKVWMDEDGVTVDSPQARVRSGWDYYDRCKETPWSFNLSGNRAWLILPKRAFSSAEEVRRARRILRARTKSAVPWV